MNRSLARSLTLLLVASIATFAYSITATAAPLPKGFNPYLFHGTYAFGNDGRDSVTRLDMRTGQRVAIQSPKGTYVDVSVASNAAFAGTAQHPPWTSSQLAR